VHTRLLPLAIGIAAVVAGGGASRPASRAADDLAARAHRVHHQAIVIDTHADLTPLIERDVRPAMIDDPGLAGPGYDATEAPSRRRPDNPWLHGFPPGPWHFIDRHTTGYMDLPRMREGGLDAQFFAVYTEQDDRPGMAVKTAISQIGAIHALAAKYPHDIGLAVTATDIRQIVESGRVAVLMGVEGGHMIDDDLNVLRSFAALGVRYLSLTHSFNTHWADSSGIGQPVEATHGGLSPFGREVVRELNRLGILVDVSHTADKTFYDALAVTAAPVIASHSGVDAVKEHARNMSDDMLRALARNGGVIQVDGVLKYIDPVARPTTPLSVFIDHIDHAIKVAGIDHVGLGMDYSPTAGAPLGLEDCSKYEVITYELMKRGYSDDDVRKVLGENTLRVMAEAERVAKSLGTDSGIATARP
jgi:membrane dipeptidase